MTHLPALLVRCVALATFWVAQSAWTVLGAQPITIKRPTGPIQGALSLPVTITAPILAQPVYAGVRTVVTVKVTNAKDGTTVQVKPIAQPSVPCGFVVAEPAVVSRATVQGVTSVTLAGMFPHVVGTSPAKCSFKAEVTVTSRDGTTETNVVNSSNITLAASSVYVVANTTDWLAKFAFANTAARGDCTGSSNGPNGIFRVGLVTTEIGQNNVDLTFKIRSGPSGTHCTWVSQPLLLPEGVKLTAVEVGVQNSGPCNASSNGPTAGFVASSNPVMSLGSVVGANPLGAGLAVQGINPITVQLDCNATLSNDRFSTFVIKSLTFVGPPQLSGFP